MDPITQQTTLAAAGAGESDPVYVDDLFSVDCWLGQGSTFTINNGIDLQGSGGFVWTKSRDITDNHTLMDSERGKTGSYYDEITPSDQYGSQSSRNWGITSFNSNGFTASGNNNQFNATNYHYVSWTFRKQKKFMDIVTYTGNGTAGHTVSHGLGCVPGAIFVKKISGSEDWAVYHKSAGAAGTFRLNSNVGEQSSQWNSTSPTSSNFTLGSYAGTNGNGEQYIAYLFADSEAVFGENQDESIIKCGSYTGNGSTSPHQINVGFEPCWVLIKGFSSPRNWRIFDTYRGTSFSYNANIKVNSAATESHEATEGIQFNRMGFEINSNNSDYNAGSNTYIYIAIRQPNMKPITDLTKNDVFDVKTGNRTVTFPFKPDLVINRSYEQVSSQTSWATRLNLAAPRSSQSASWEEFDSSSGLNYFEMDHGHRYIGPSYMSNHLLFAFKRQKKFFDCLVYTGSNNTQNIPHNLGVEPNIMLIKSINSGNTSAGRWSFYHKGVWDTSGYTEATGMFPNDTNFTGSSELNQTAPTSTQFTVGYNQSQTNQNNVRYMAWLFADVPGVMKTGVFTGTGNNINIDCGFTNGARFVMVKRLQGGNYYVWNSGSGIVSGNDPFFSINSQYDSETNRDYIDPYSAGFTITSNATNYMNPNGQKMLFWALA